MGTAFDDMLAGLDAPAETAATEPAPPPVDAEDPNDPLAKYIGRGSGAEEKSAFDAFLDGVADENKDFVPEPQPVELHDWGMVTKAIYSHDNCVWLCQRCARTVSVERGETLRDAMAKSNIREECATEVIAGVMET
jgi:hypothetical protein